MSKFMALCDQIFLAIWSVQDKIDRVRTTIEAAYEWCKAKTFDGYASHVIYANSLGTVEPITVYNYDDVWSLIRMVYKRFVLRTRKLPMMPSTFRRLVSGAKEDSYDMMIFKYYRDGKKYFEVVNSSSPSDETAYISDGNESQEKASFHHLHSPYMIAFVTASDDDTMKEVSKEFSEVGVLLAKAGVTVKVILAVIAEFYSGFDYEALPNNYKFNLMLPKRSLCVYKENERIIV